MKKIKFLLSIAAIITLSGCAVVSIHEPTSGKIAFRSWSPAWPWQDSTKVLQKAMVTQRDNSNTNKYPNFMGSLAGFNESETTSTNAVALIEGVVSSAVSAAIKSVKP